MAIRAIPTISEPIYLQDISTEVKEMEGHDCPREEQAWVIVRQGTEADNCQRAAMRSKYTLRWQNDGSAEEERDVNQRELWTLEVYMTLCGAGGIFSDEECTKPLFEFEKGKSFDKITLDFAKFKGVYGTLPSIVTTAILRAVYSLNPDWSWMIAQKKEGEA